MSESLVNDKGPSAAAAGLDLVVIDQALMSASTSIRIAKLHQVDETIRHKSSSVPSPYLVKDMCD